MANTDNSGAMIRVWDPVVRIGHWVLVAGFAIAYLSEGEPEWLHAWSGYIVGAVVVLRVVWGFVGPRRARFTDFVTGPRSAIAYLRDMIAGRSRRYVGHSPAGGAMTVALLLALALTTFTGMATLAVEENRGPLAPWFGSVAAAIDTGAPSLVAAARADDDAGKTRGKDSLWKDVHDILSSLTLALIIGHVAGVTLASVVHRENLARAMVTGLKRP